jgi:hypothetical protein
VEERIRVRTCQSDLPSIVDKSSVHDIVPVPFFLPSLSTPSTNPSANFTSFAEGGLVLAIQEVIL